MSREKVLNARISKKLYDKISERARKNRITVSNLIRNLVEDALELHDDFHNAVDKKIKKYLSDNDVKNLLGFNEFSLAKDTNCDNCSRNIKASETAYLAYFDGADEKAILCHNCKNKYATASGN